MYGCTMDPQTQVQRLILFIEDDEFLQTMYRQTLEDQGYSLMRASTGEAGLQLAREHRPDLIVLDIILPPGKLNGFEVLESLRKDPALAHTPVIVFSNLENEEQTAKNLGATDFLIKVRTPIPDLVDRINKALQPRT